MSSILQRTSRYHYLVGRVLTYVRHFYYGFAIFLRGLVHVFDKFWYPRIRTLGRKEYAPKFTGGVFYPLDPHSADYLPAFRENALDPRALDVSLLSPSSFILSPSSYLLPPFLPLSSSAILRPPFSPPFFLLFFYVSFFSFLRHTGLWGRNRFAVGARLQQQYLLWTYRLLGRRKGIWPRISEKSPSAHGEKRAPPGQITRISVSRIILDKPTYSTLFIPIAKSNDPRIESDRESRSPRSTLLAFKEDGQVHID